MHIKTPGKKQVSQEEIDPWVSAQADDDLAWDEPIYGHPTPPTALSLPSELAARATFIAH